MKITKLLMIIFVIGSFAKIDAQTDKKLKFNGYARWRAFETNWSGENGDSYYRSRVNFKFGLTYKIHPNITLGARVRTGNEQYSYVTLGGGNKSIESDRRNITLEKLYAKFKYKNYWAWVGKNTKPYKNQGGTFWDIYTPEGISAGAKYKISDKLTLKPELSYFVYNQRGDNYKDGRIYSAQLGLDYNTDKISAGFITSLIGANDLTNLAFSSKSRLLQDYNFWNNTFFVKFKDIKNLTFAVDVYQNTRNYGKDELHTVGRKKGDINLYGQGIEDDKTGYVASVSVSPGKWKFLYAYRHIEQLANMDFFGKWSFTGGRTASNYTSHELRASYKFNKHFYVMGRTYFGARLNDNGYDFGGADKDSRNRFRLDFTFKF